MLVYIGLSAKNISRVDFFTLKGKFCTNWFYWSDSHEVKYGTPVISLLLGYYNCDNILYILACYDVMYLHMSEYERVIVATSTKQTIIPRIAATAASSHLKALVFMFT